MAGAPDTRPGRCSPTALRFPTLPKLTKYGAIAAATLQNRLAYFYDQFFRSLFLVVIIYVFVALWRTTYGVTGATRISGYTLPEMIWYLVATETIVMSVPRLVGRIDEEVRSGDLAYTLSRPYHYLLFNYATFLGEAALLLVVNFAVSAAVAAATVGGFPYRWEGLPVQLLAVLLSLSLNFFLLISIGLLAFWLEDTVGLYLLVDRTQWILGGLLLPVEVFPLPLRRIALHLPFRYVIAGPARLLVKYDRGEVPAVLGNQALWLSVFILVAFGIYALGVKRVNANGG